jgi:hypothetical protein
MLNDGVAPYDLQRYLKNAKLIERNMEAIEVQLRTRFAYLTNRYCATKT